MDEELERYHEDRTNRLEHVASEINEMQDPDDMMLAITEILTETELTPDVGKFYTFIYNAKTPNISYDQHPLIACVEVFRWGFRGLNFHWQNYRNYTWEELPGQLHVVEFQELDELLALQYGKFILNN